jgi:hypothetical protein
MSERISVGTNFKLGQISIKMNFYRNEFLLQRISKWKEFQNETNFYCNEFQNGRNFKMERSSKMKRI